MENKYLALIVIAVVAIFAIISIFSLTYIFTSLSSPFIKNEITDDLPIKNETFEGVKIAVPADSTFKKSNQNEIYPKIFTSNEYGIIIYTYITDSHKRDIDYLIPSYIEMNNLTEINLEGLPDNAKAYVDPTYNYTVEIIIISDEGDKAVHLMVDDNEKFAIKMANSVVFPN